MRGVAPKEAREAILGKNGRVQDEVALTNRGNDISRLAFGMNEPNTPGINPKIVDEFILDASFYANLGAYAEAHPDELKRNLHPDNRGYLLVFATAEPLPIHGENLVYGHSWRTTSELPPWIEENLVGVAPAAPMKSASRLEDYNQGDYCLFGNKININDFNALEAIVNSK